MTQVTAELSKDGKTVLATFEYDPMTVTRIKRVPSRRFVSGDKPEGPAWRLDKDLTTMRRLREQFGTDLVLGERLRAWGVEQVEEETHLRARSQANDADLDFVPDSLITGNGNGGFKLRPYQKADIKFMSEGRYVNANKPGSGKTAEAIGAVFEAQLEWGQHLVFAPLISLEDIWEREILAMYERAGYDEPTVLTGNSTAQRKVAIREAKAMYEEGYAFWLVLNPETARLKRKLTAEGKARAARNEDVHKEHYEETLAFPALSEIEWDSINVDEFHLMGLSNPQTQAAAGINYIANETNPQIRGALSGTPMGGKPIKLWGALHFIHPEQFTARWSWARQWLVVKDNGYGHHIEGIVPGREEEFYDHLKQYLIRRTKAEVLPGLPPKNQIDVWCHMSPKQEQQYRTFELEAELRIAGAEDEGRLVATNVLAEYTRLKQFAAAYCDIRYTGREVNGIPEIKVEATLDSGKFAHLEEKLREENVIVSGKDDDDPPATALIFTQHNAVAYAAQRLLNKYEVPNAVILGVGKVTDRDRKAAARAFQSQDVEFVRDIKRPSALMKQLLADGPPRVLVVGTKAGGTALNLSRADSVHILDETWTPDDQEQAEDRAHRGDELTEAKDEVRIYYYRTRNSVEEYVKQLVADKDLNNKVILDLVRKLREQQEGE